MRHRRLLLTFAAVWLLVAVPVRGRSAEPELIVETDVTEVYQGESLVYHVTINHVDNPEPPVLEGFDDFQVELLGSRSLDSRQITIVNGVRTDVIRRGRQFSYRLTPERSGRLTIPAPLATVGTNTLRGPEVELLVIAPEAQEIVSLRLSAEPASVYPTQSFMVSLDVAVRGLPGELGSRDPMTVQPSPPVLSIPWLDDERLPAGVLAEKTWQEILEPLAGQRGVGFQVNSITNSSVLSLFEQRAAGFHPVPERIQKPDGTGAVRDYWVYRFQRSFVADRPGPLDFGRVSVKGTFGTETQRGKLQGQKIYAISEPLVVTVREVPEEGRPDSFSGAVGTFEFSARLTPTTARVGDPMTLVLRLQGQGSLSATRAPEIASLPGVQGVFRTYEATEESRQDDLQFVYSLRPLQAGTTEFPAVQTSWFDVGRGEYVTRATSPVPVTILQSEALQAEQIVAAGPPSGAQPRVLAASEGGIFANDSRLQNLRNESVSIGGWIRLWGVMTGGFLAGLALRRGLQWRLSDPAGIRRRGARSRAEAALKAAERLQSRGDFSSSCDEFRRAVVGLVADHLNISAEGLTPRDVDAGLERIGVDTTLRGLTQEFLWRCDAARYGATHQDPADLSGQSRRLVDQLSLELKPAVKRSRAATAAVMLGLVLAETGCSAGDNSEAARRFLQAEQSFSAANTPEEFVTAAAEYQSILDSGLVSGMVLYNQGNAWMRAGQPGRAIACYRRAERLRPRDAMLAANLRSACSAVAGTLSGNSENSVRLVDYLLFWQRWLSYREKLYLTTALLGVSLLSAFLIVWPSGRIPQLMSARWLLMASLVCFAGAAAATARDWYDIDQTVHGVVVEKSVTARKGNSERYEPAYTEPLREGTEFVVLERRTDWLRIQPPEIGESWIPERSAQLY